MKRVSTGVLGCLLLSMFLVSGKLVEIAERQPLGDSRNRWVDVAEGVDRVSNFLALNRPYDLITDVRGVGTDAGEEIDTIEDVAAALGRERGPLPPRGQASTATPRPRPTAADPATAAPKAPAATDIPHDSGATRDAEASPTPDAGEEPQPTQAADDAGSAEQPEALDASSEPEPIEGTPNPQPEQIDREPLIVPQWQVPPVGPWLLPPPKNRTVTPDDPLRVYVAGDSQAFFPGHALTDVVERGLFDVTMDFRNSTGLARPDFFNWPAEFLDFAAEEDPELVVLFLGGNDWQTMENSEGTLLRRGSDAWRSEWAWRMQITFDTLTAPHRHIVWVGLPPARSEPFDTGYPQINDISWLVTLTRSDVTMVDIWDLFGGDGPYEESVAPPTGGDPVRVRQEDGIHVNRTGARWVAELIAEIAAERWEFEESG
ncbi:DUF459 domain-containing protein [Candidatus Poriferisocius sp.]|uniref:DUF459 domain-containing protein n=1 Tax=Candidatus Poriferisocius sp. TaxID=3101276 RepID=UPI003B01237A